MESRITDLQPAQGRDPSRIDDIQVTRRHQLDTDKLTALVEILREVRRLRDTAAANDLTMLAYLLDMAALEAEHLASGPLE